jgi:hypothetical protein
MDPIKKQGGALNFNGLSRLISAGSISLDSTFKFSLNLLPCCVCTRVSFETSFDSKQPKLKPKLVSALSETKRLFWLFSFFTETESFDVSIEPKQQKTNRNRLIGSIFCHFLQKILSFSGFFVFFSVFSVCLVRLYTETESFDVSIEPKQAEDPPKQFKREYIWVFFRKLRVVSVCFGLFRFVTKQFCLFRLFRYRFETLKQTKIFCFWFNETNRNKRKTDLVRTEIYFCLFRGQPSLHPTP